MYGGSADRCVAATTKPCSQRRCRSLIELVDRRASPPPSLQPARDPRFLSWSKSLKVLAHFPKTNRNENRQVTVDVFIFEHLKDNLRTRCTLLYINRPQISASFFSYNSCGGTTVTSALLSQISGIRGLPGMNGQSSAFQIQSHVSR